VTDLNTAAEPLSLTLLDDARSSGIARR